MVVTYPYTFGLLLGKCLWHPPSGKAAVLAILWLFGQADPDVAREAMVQQYVSSGFDQSKAKDRVTALEACFVVPEEKKEPEGQ